MYRIFPSAVPGASERGILRFGSFTSPAVKVILFQASEEKSEPTCATQKAMNKPNAPPAAVTVAMNGKFGLIGLTPLGVQRSVKLALVASAFRPKKSPIRIRAMSERVFVEVKIF